MARAGTALTVDQAIASVRNRHRFDHPVLSHRRSRQPFSCSVQLDRVEVHLPCDC